MSIKKIVIIGILLIILGLFVVNMMGTQNNQNIKNVTTPYGTTTTLNIGKGVSNESTVNEYGQKLVFNDGYKEGVFISTTRDVSDIIKNIETGGTKCARDNIVWYHMKDQQLANSYSVFGGTHLKLEDTNEFDVGFMKNPNSNETIILVGSPDTIVDCFKNVKWGGK